MNTTYKVALGGTLGALGILLRSLYLEITPNVQLTPGMIPPALAGMLMGLEGGFITGLIVGIYGALLSGEFPLIPLIGNVLLGIGPGIIYEILDDTRTSLKSILYVMLTGFIGGFIPTFSFLLILVPPPIAALSALFDLTNAMIAGTIGVIIWFLIRNWSFAYSLFKKDQKANLGRMVKQSYPIIEGISNKIYIVETITFLWG